LFANGPVTLVNVSFISNTAYSHGGGAFIPCCHNLFAYPTSLISGGVFQGNESLDYGGGLFLQEGAVTLSGTAFIENTSEGSGGGAFLSGPATVTDGLFQSNECVQSNCNGGGVAGETVESLLITGTRFLSNTSAGKGGGVYTEGLLRVHAAQFIGNGGALYHLLGTLEVVNSLFAQDQGYALDLHQSDALIIHTTIAGPNPGSASAVLAERSTVGITNTIIANYPTGILEANIDQGMVYQDYNLFFNVGSPTGRNVTTGGHSRTGNPNFINPGANDYHLGIGSAAVDAGRTSNVLVDFEGESRPVGLFVDIGFDEAPFALLYTFLPLLTR
jgi:predicted outer membrane repeat protein